MTVNDHLKVVQISLPKIVGFFVIVDTPTASKLVEDLDRVVAPIPWPGLMLAYYVDLSEDGVQA
ncbi:MAG: hypothetical protein OSA11_00665 [Candidatus Nanopelagicales bacterium]|nr:hypothetical protein [Candidatus Nanopelagicales bacterium]